MVEMTRPLTEIEAETEAAILAAIARRKHAKTTGGALRPLSLERASPIARAPAVAGDLRPRAESRAPCPRCGARGDYDCAHQRPCEDQQ